MKIKTEGEIKSIKKSGKILAACHKKISKMIQPGITTLDINHFVESFLMEHGANSATKGYQGFNFSICTSVNDEICHGIPTKEPLQNGDIVTIDIVVEKDGWLADSAWTYPVGTISKEAEKLLYVTKEALYKGIERACMGNRIGDIGQSIEQYVESEGFSVVRDFVGHGIGKDIHEEPPIPHFRSLNRGPILREGMVITIEPMVTIGSWKTKNDPNGWTARTIDGSLAAQYEHTIAITKKGPILLTEQL